METEALCGGILTGGQSTRMGQPKALLPLSDGRTMLEHVLAAMRGVCSEVVAVGHVEGGALPVAVLADLQRGRGPLGGLETLLVSGRARRYLVATCDQPQITSELLRKLTLGDAERPHIFRTANPQDFLPFPGYYPAALLENVRDCLNAGRGSVRALLATTHPVWIELTEAEAALPASVNTPEQYEHLLNLKRNEPCR